jgi:WD40 repeat protein
MTTLNQRPNPYVGPRAFETGEPLFGRDKEINELINILIAERIVLLYSPSGAGKTSLIGAGLLPLLEKEGFPPLPIVRVNLAPPESTEEYHFNRFIYSTLMSLEEGLPKEQQTSLETLSKMSLAEYLAQRPKPEKSSDDDFWERAEVLIFDQFEEFITTSPLDLQSKAEFFAQLGEALRDKSRWALFSMREDFIGALDPYRREIQNHMDVRFRLNLLGKEAARQAIQQPARQVGVEFTDSAAQKLVENLSHVQTQLPDGSIVEESGPYVEPVQLQVVCYRLWRHLATDDMLINEDDLEMVGDVDRSLVEYYDDCIRTVVEKSGESEHSIRFWFEHRLITEGKIRSQVLMEKHSSQGLANQAIFELDKTHLIRRDIRQGKTWFELAHDRLIKPVRESNAAWFKVQQSPFQQQAAFWEEQNYPDHLLLTGKELTKVEQWVSEQKRPLSPLEKKFLDSCRKADAQQTKKRLRRSRLSIAILTFLTLLSCGCGGISLFLYYDAEYQRQKAEEQTQYAEVQRQRAEEQTIIAQDQRKKAEEQTQYAEVQRQRAEEQTIIAQDQRQRAEFERQVRSLEAQALSKIEAEPDLAMLLGLEAYQLEKSHGSRGVLLDVIVKNKYLQKYVRHHRNSVMAIAFRPDGQILATGSEDGTVVLWDRFAHLPLNTPLLQENANMVYSLAFSPNGEILTAGTKDGRVYIWDIRDPLSPAVLLETFSDHVQGVYSMAFSTDGKLLATASDDGTALLWDIETLRLFRQIDYPAVSLAFSPDGNHLALGSREGLITVIDTTTYEQTAQYRHSNRVFSLQFSPDSRILASGSSDKTIILWDMENNRQIDRLAQHTSYVYTLAFSADGQKLASGGRDHTVLIWDMNSRQISNRLHGHTWTVVSLAFDPLNNTRLLSGSWDKTFIEWNLGITQPLAFELDLSTWPIPTHLGWISSMAFKPGSRILASADANGKVFFWNLDERLSTGEPLTLDQMARALAYSPDGQLLAIGSCSSLDEQWNCSTGQLILRDADGLDLIGETLTAHNNWIVSLAFNNDNSLLATGSWDHTVILWDISDPAAPEKLSITEHSTGVQTVTLSPDGKILASGSEDGQVNFWDVGNPMFPRLLSSLAVTSRYGVSKLAFSPDGLLLASSTENGEVILVDVKTGQVIGSSLLGHKGPVRSVVFSPNGQILASAGDDGVIILWDAANRARIGQPLSGHSGEIYSLAFSPDGKNLFSGGAYGKLLLWSIADEDLEQIACAKIARNLTAEEVDHYLHISQDKVTCPGVTAQDKLFEADAYALSGDINQAASAFEEAVQYAAGVDDVSLNNSICWYGSLDGFAEIVMPACERAVELSTFRSMVLDSRGLAHALSGNYAEAINDFSEFIATFEGHSSFADLVAIRRNWVADLRAGRNPFDAETLKSLRQE